MIIYLSLKYAQVNTSLEEQLVQVKKLSEDNLRSEQEKQQLLASQNEMLEKTVEERTIELKQSLEELKINTSPTHPIRKNGFTWRTHCRHCT